MNIFNNKVNPFDQLPVEIIAEIFSYLPPRARIQAAAVCKVWREVATDECCLKKAFFPSLLKIKIDSPLWERIIKNQRMCFNEADLINKIDQFFRLYPCYKEFSYTSIPNPLSKLTITIKNHSICRKIDVIGIGYFGDFYEKGIHWNRTIRLTQSSLSWKCPFIHVLNLDFSVVGTNFDKHLFRAIINTFDGEIYYN